MRPLGAVSLVLSVVLLLSGCGSDEGPTAADDPTPAAPATSPSATPTPTPTATATASATTTAAPSLPGQEAARAFRAFARGGSTPPLADQVDLYLGNAFTGFVTRARADQPTAWATCTEIGEYAGRACPLSPLEVLAGHPAVSYAQRPDSRCLKTYGPVPPDLRRLTRVTIVPAPGTVDSCIDDFAVQLFLDPDGDLAAVSLLRGEP